jgi:hypothetical protein
LPTEQTTEGVEHIEVYRCDHCKGVASILIHKHSEKGTWPEIEFCPFCGLSKKYLPEFDNEHGKSLNKGESIQGRGEKRD